MRSYPSSISSINYRLGGFDLTEQLEIQFTKVLWTNMSKILGL